ncbi:MAG: enoyl-CoA hydratase/isomerase family protein [Chloroflexi bacterium]|nr:enoyl-CoA hydratase/isomerase family protein [Chloroflexota bacterium]
MPTYETILYEKRDGVACIALNRPERLNAVNRPMKVELRQAWQDVNTDRDVRVVILTGTGTRAFCAGADLKQAAAQGFEPGQKSWVTPIDCGVRKPIVCAVNGVCSGGAIGFVADSDLVICAENAYFKDGRVSNGVVSVVGTTRLTRRIPLQAVLRLALLGKHGQITSQQALALGLVGEVVPSEQLMETAWRLALAIAENSPAAVMATKAAIWDTLNSGLDAAVEQSWRAIAAYRGHPDITEGPRAFAEHRKPQWQPPA